MILIKNTTIIDGTGKPPFKGDILIKDDRNLTFLVLHYRVVLFRNPTS